LCRVSKIVFVEEKTLKFEGDSLKTEVAIHEKFGKGIITEINDKIVKVRFTDNKEKSFEIDSFYKYFKPNKLVENILSKKRMEKENKERAIVKEKKLKEYEEWKKKVNTIPGIDDQEKNEKLFEMRIPTNCWNCKTDLSYNDSVCKTCRGYVCSKCGKCLCGTYWSRLG
jgi:hypothetical protein